MTDEVKLIGPRADFREEFIAYCEEFQAAAEPFAHWSADEARRDFAGLVRRWDKYGVGVGLPQGYVPQTTYWFVRGGTILGTGRLRHRLNEQLSVEGGHIGYEIRPSERGKGYATRMLGMMLEEARALRLGRVLVTCQKDNAASARVIAKNGGVLAGEVISPRTGKLAQQYWIEL